MTPAEMLPLIIRLSRYYTRKLDDTDVQAHATEFARRLGRFSPATVQRAVEAHLDAEPFYPTPNKLLDRCRDEEDRQQRRQPKRRGPEIRGGPLRPLPEIMRELRIVRDDDTTEGAA